MSSSGNKPDRVERQLKTTDFFLAIFAFASAAAAVVSAWIAAKTLNEMKSGAAQTQQAINQIAALANSAQAQASALEAQVGPLGREAHAAEQQAASTEQSLGVSRQTFTLGQRAWIATVGIANGKGAPGNRVDAGMMYQNTGHSPATDLNVAQRFTFVPTVPLPGPDNFGFAAPPFDSCDQQRPVSGGDTVFPSASPTGATSIPMDRRPAYAPDLPEMKRILVWQGCFAYNTLGKAHHTRFCFWFRPIPGQPMSAWDWDPCSHGNSAD